MFAYWIPACAGMTRGGGNDEGAGNDERGAICVVTYNHVKPEQRP